MPLTCAVHILARPVLLVFGATGPWFWPVRIRLSVRGILVT